MRSFICIAIFCVFLVWAKNVRARSSDNADQHYSDSIEVLLRAAKADTVKAGILNELSDYWSEKDSARSIYYALSSLRLSNGSIYYTAAAHFYIGGSWFYNNPNASEEEYLKVIDLLKKDSSQRSLSLLSRAWHNYGALLQRKDNNRAYMSILLDHTIPLAKIAKDTLHEGIDYSGVAEVFSNILDYNKAIAYYRQAIQLLRLVDKPGKALASCYTNMAKTYLYKKDYPSAKPYLDSAGRILSGLPPSFDQVDYLMTSGMYYSHVHQWSTAFDYLNKAHTLAIALNLPYEANGILFQKYKAYTEAKKYSKAKQVLLQVYRDSTATSKPENKAMFLYYLAQTDAKMGNMKSAYRWLFQYASLADSLNNERIKSDIAGLEVKYQSEKKQRKILSLQNENRQQLLVLQKKLFVNYFLLAGIFILLLISLIILMLYRNKRHKAIQENQMHQQQLKQIAQDYQMKIYNAMLEGQEQERRRMARDLHDGLGGILAGVKLKLSDIAYSQGNKYDMELYKVIGQLDNSVQELRRIARNMMPETLIRFGVETALKDLCDSLKSPSLHIDLQLYPLKRDLSQQVQITIYRIVQELLANAVKHAQASDILVQCSQNKDRIFITVEDNGQGFDMNSIQHKNGIGMTNIRNRIAFLHGKLDIQSEPGEGTTANVEVNDHE